MAGTYSDSIQGSKSPQYACALAILSGGVAFVVSQMGDPVAALLLFALLAALFASIWPDSGLQWAGWLCLPIVLLVCFEVIITGSIYKFRSNGVLFLKAVPVALLGAYVGSKLSVRKITNRYANERASRKRLTKRAAHQDSLILKNSTKPLGNIKPIVSTRRSNGRMRALERKAAVQDINAALIKAAQEGDLEKIRLLTAQGANVNAESKERFTPLMIAALGGDVEMAGVLFGNGAAPDAADGFKGWTALMIATIEGHAEVVSALIEQGADVNARNSRGWTALRFAVSMDETEVLRLLTAAGADVNSVDGEGQTALMQAAGEDSSESLRILLDAGADPLVKDKNGRTALMIARELGHAKSVRLLKEAAAKASAVEGEAKALAYDDSYFYLLKEELEEKLNHASSSKSSDDVTLLLRSALQTVQEHIDSEKREALLAPSEISHKLLLTLREAATLSGLPRHHLLEAIESSSLKAQLIKHGWRIRRADLDDYVRRLS
ncbi:MAG: ankyrin repeat domain-containing protein [Pyrinomonadaceae bacterium]|nr:ankyrin repeat domain-containing protein [Pyrinomonadaceae bacterium]